VAAKYAAAADAAGIGCGVSWCSVAVRASRLSGIRSAGRKSQMWWWSETGLDHMLDECRKKEDRMPQGTPEQVLATITEEINGGNRWQPLSRLSPEASLTAWRVSVKGWLVSLR
jgi:hypothetical protein